MKAIKTTYLGAANFRPSRMKATDGDRNSVIVSYDGRMNTDDNHKAAAKALCEKMGWNGEMIMGGFPTFAVHVFVGKVA